MVAGKPQSHQFIWSWPQRILHWGFVLCIALGWWSAGKFDAIHNWSGYVLLGLIGLRVVLSIISKHPNAHGGVIIKKLCRLPNYISNNLKGEHQKTEGLSPTGVVSVLVLLSLSVYVALTGWMLTWEDYVGEPWLEELHGKGFDILLIWIGLHVIFVLLTSVLQKHNKLKDMLTGGKSDRG